MSWSNLENESSSSRIEIRPIQDGHEHLQSGYEANSYDSSDCTGTSTNAENPFYSLPAEVMSLILWWCCPTYNDHYRGPPTAPLMLSHVCQLWRNTAFQTPSLWTYLILTVDYSSTSGLEKARQQLDLWLSRVQDCPILIEIELPERAQQHSPDNVFRQMKMIIDMVLACKPSIDQSGMKLTAALDASAPSPSSPDEEHPLILEQYTWAKSDMRPDRPAPGSVQIHASRYANIVYGLEGHSTLGPYLKHLNLCDPDGAIQLTIEESQIALSMFAQLEYCAVRIGESTDEAVDDIQLPCLQTLSLTWNERAGISALLGSITSPALKELELKGPLLPREYFSANRWVHLRQFLERSSPQLVSLSLAKMDCTTLDILGCLALCQGLQRLSLRECRLDEEIMTSLQNTAAGTPTPTLVQAIMTLKDLDSLELVFCNIFSLDEFLRANANSTLWEEMNLTRLYIIECGYISEDVLAAFRELPLEEFETSPDVLDDEFEFE